MELPVNIHQTQRCTRCGLEYPKGDHVCPHCHGLSDRQVLELQHKFEQEQESNANLGRLFIYLAVVLVIGLILLGLLRA